jgi:hypothetical protein
MLGLSVWQPWAWLIVNGYKDIENRNWWTRFTGRFLVHASKRMDNMTLTEIVEQYHVKIDDPEAAQREIKEQRGGIVGVAKMTNCCDYSTCDGYVAGMAPWSLNSLKWFHGPYGFVLRDAAPLPFFPLRGRQGFFETGLEIVDGKVVYGCR